MENFDGSCDGRCGPGYEPLLDIRAVAAWLNVSEHAVRKWVQQGPRTGLVPRMLRVNGQVRFRRDDVITWLESKEMA